MNIRNRFNLSLLAIQHSWVTICVWIAVSVAGLFAFSSLEYALFPNITFPVVVVNVNAQASLEATTVEAQLTIPIEESLQSLEGLDKLYSSTYPGQTAITLLFSPGTSLEASTQKVDRILEELKLPPQATYEVIPFNLNESTAVSYAIQSESKSLTQLTQIAQEQIIPTIAELPGVLTVNFLGEGLVGDGELPESLVSKFPTLVRFDGENALAFEVVKSEEANTLAVVKLVEQAVQSLQSELEEVQFTLAQTQADYIREATQATIDALIVAIALAVAVIFGFLRNVPATLITALAIPLSLLGTFIVMALFGFNLETITLLAIALVIGIIVDDAIVEIENIARHIEAGETPRQAAILATSEIGLTVSASTLTIVAVFLPVAFMGGTVGQFFKPFGLTVSAAVLMSLLVARTLSPVLAIYWLKVQQTEPTSRRSPLVNYYYNLLHWSLHHRHLVVAIALVTFIAGIALTPLIPQGFIPKLDRGEFNLTYTTSLPQLSSPSAAAQSQSNSPEPESSPASGDFNWLADLANPTNFLLSRTRNVGQQLEAAVLRSPAVESIYTLVGVEGEPNRGRLYIKLKPDRQVSTAEVQSQIRDTLPSLPGVTLSIEDIQFINTKSQKSLQVGLLGENLALLRRTAEAIKARVEDLPGFVDVSVSADAETKIERRDGQRVVYLEANLGSGQALGGATDQIVDVAQSLLPEGVSLDLGSDSARSAQVLESFAGTLSLSVICMLAVLLLLFGRLLEPIVVGLCLPLAVVGAMLGLLVTQSEFDMISVIGLIFLLGLLDKNALLLMDYANQLRKSGLSRTEALLKTGVVRLRPILMTTASTILGMLPIAAGLGAGAELRQPMAVAIIGGLITSSLLSLIVVPVVYTLLEDAWGRVFKRRKYG